MPVVFILTGLLAGVAGALFTVNYGEVSPFMGDDVGTKAIAAMVLGGIGSIWGAIAGGLIIGLTETLSIHFLGGDSVADGRLGAASRRHHPPSPGIVRRGLDRQGEDVMQAPATAPYATGDRG